MYQQLAAFYDNDAREEFSLACARLVDERFEAAEITSGATVLDLACGTGRLLQELHQRGYTVTGIDLSPSMLELARQRDYCGAEPPRVSHGDIRDLAMANSFQAILCFGDVINHLTDPADLKAMFHSVFRALVPGGLFLADCNTLETFRSCLWNTASPPQAWKGGRISVRSMFDEEDGLAHMEAVLALPGQPTVVERLAERYYEDQRVRELLVEAGLDRIDSSPFNSFDFAECLPEISVLKTLWSARKPD